MLLPTCDESPTEIVGLRRTNEETPVFFFLASIGVGSLTCSATAVGGGGGAIGLGGGGVFIDGIHMILFRLVLSKSVPLDRSEADEEAEQLSVFRYKNLYPEGNLKQQSLWM